MKPKLILLSLLAPSAALGLAIALPAMAQTEAETLIANSSLEAVSPVDQSANPLAEPRDRNAELPALANAPELSVLDPEVPDPLDALLVSPDEAMSQVTSISELSDVQPTDWAFQALQSLVERYGCIEGYPDGWFRGNRSLSRYEFAAAVNACMDRMTELLAVATDDLATKDDLAALRRLQDEFASEIATVRNRVDNLESRIAELESNQFSTTTKLKAEVIFGYSDASGNGLGDVHTVLQDRVRLNFLTSFTGRDLLQTRLQAGNAPPLLLDEAGTNEGRFTYDGPSGNNVELDILRYIFPVGDTLTFQILANDALHHYYVDTVNPFFEGLAGGENAISRFAERNPIYRIGAFGAGAAVAWKPTKHFRVDLGYIANESNDPSIGAGLFNGNYSAIAQVVVGDRYKLGLTYVHAYDGTRADSAPSRFTLGGTGTGLANLIPSQLADATSLSATSLDTPISSNSYGIQTSLRFSPKFIVNGWVGKTDARLIGLGDADIWNFAVTLGFPDLLLPGNFGGIVFGAEPTLRGLDVPGEEDFSRDFAFHIEGFYKLRINDNLLITPGIIWLTSPNQNSDNGDALIGTLRTTFTF